MCEEEGGLVADCRMGNPQWFVCFLACLTDFLPLRDCNGVSSLTLKVQTQAFDLQGHCYFQAAIHLMPSSWRSSHTTWLCTCVSCLRLVEVSHPDLQTCFRCFEVLQGLAWQCYLLFLIPLVSCYLCNLAVHCWLWLLIQFQSGYTCSSLVIPVCYFHPFALSVWSPTYCCFLSQVNDQSFVRLVLPPPLWFVRHWQCYEVTVVA